MKNNPQRTSIDGLIPRRPNSAIGELHDRGHSRHVKRVEDRSVHTGDSVSESQIGTPRAGKEIGHDDLIMSLRGLDEEQPQDHKTRKKDRRKDKKGGLDKKSKRRRIIKWASILLLVTILAIGAFIFIRGYIAGNNIFQGNMFDVLKNEPLKEDENGRSNFLIFGTAEDSEGGMHGGANLTDSVMVLSINQTKKDAYMLSLPRDMWVRYDEACTVGYEGKLNATYFCASNDGGNEEAGAKALQKKVGEITGLDMQYYIHLNFTAVTDAVDAVGGVDVTIKSDDPRGILDRNFDWRCGYQCYYVNYKNGEKVHLDGEHALALARARNAAGGYGLPNGNFDREKNQQMIIVALRDKALSAGTLTNLGAVTGLIDALGNNLRTSIETKEIRTLMDVVSKIDTDNIISLSLNDSEEMLVTTGMYSGQSIVRPVLGIMEYSDIHAYVKRQMTSDPFVKESPHVTVLNGSSVVGAGQKEADTLTDMGFIVDEVGNVPGDSVAEKTVVYAITKEKPATKTKLESLYKTTVSTGTPPKSVVGETHFVIVIGKDIAQQ